jgi:hypothetical protein
MDSTTTDQPLPVSSPNGGSYFNNLKNGRSAIRAWEAPKYRWDYIGVRPVRALDR